MLNVIKQAAKDAVEATKPVAVQYGAVTQINPLSVLVDQRLALPEDLLVITESLMARRALAVGDQLVLLRFQGGQRYLILDRAVSSV